MFRSERFAADADARRQFALDVAVVLLVLGAGPRNVDSDLIEVWYANGPAQPWTSTSRLSQEVAASRDRIMTAAGSCGGPGWSLPLGPLQSGNSGITSVQFRWPTSPFRSAP